MPSEGALPGPRASPIVGAALKFDLANPQLTLLQLAQKYGLIMQVRIKMGLGKAVQAWHVRVPGPANQPRTHSPAGPLAQTHQGSPRLADV